jgi:hypothetical protein
MFNYHNTIKKKIREGKFISARYGEHKFKEGVLPALILTFEDKTYPIREHKWSVYQEILRI